MALDELLDEHEQGERVRDWLRRNGAGLVGGVVLGLALIGGWRWWESRQHEQRVAAGERYQATLETLAGGDVAGAQARLAELEGSAYAPIAALDVAKAQVDAGQADAAIATLQQVRDADAPVARIIDQRLARLLIDAGKHQEALARLAGAGDAASLEIRGDALLAMGKHAEARKAYQDALTQMDVAAPQRRLLEVKLTDVGGAPAKPQVRS